MKKEEVKIIKINEEMEAIKNSIQSDAELFIDYEKVDYIDDIISEVADAAVDIYNYNLLTWYSNNLYRMEYAQQAIDEHGADDFVKILQIGQYIAIAEELQEDRTDLLIYYALNYIKEEKGLHELDITAYRWLQSETEKRFFDTLSDLQQFIIDEVIE